MAVVLVSLPLISVGTTAGLIFAGESWVSGALSLVFVLAIYVGLIFPMR